MESNFTPLLHQFLKLLQQEYRKRDISPFRDIINKHNLSISLDQLHELVSHLETDGLVQKTRSGMGDDPYELVLTLKGQSHPGYLKETITPLEIKEKKFLFLKHLYDDCEGLTSGWSSVQTIGLQMDLTQEVAYKIARRLSDEGYISIETKDGDIKITKQGIDKMESAENENSSQSHSQTININNYTNIQGDFNGGNLKQKAGDQLSDNTTKTFKIHHASKKPFHKELWIQVLAGIIVLAISIIISYLLSS